MLALAVLVLQSVATSAVYATDLVDPSAETESIASVETEVEDGVSDESNDDDVVTNQVEPKVVTPVVEETTPKAEESASNGEEPKVDVESEEKTEEVPAETETPVAEELTSTENETEEVEEVKTEEEPLIENFYMPDFSYKNFMAPIQRIMLNVDNPKWACDENSTTTCIIDPVHTVGSLDKPWDVQITKVVEAIEWVDWEYKITVEVKWNPVETVETTQNNICSVVVFDKSGSMKDWETEDVCVETYEAWECMSWFFGCLRRANGWECKRYQSQSKKWNDAVGWAKTFATTLNQLNNNWNVAKIWLVTFATDVHMWRELAFNDLNDWLFWTANWWTNLDAWLIMAQQLLESDEFCNSNNSKKYIVAITDWAPTYAKPDASIWNGHDTSDAVLNQTYSDANSIKSDDIEIFTIWYMTDDDTNAILTNIASTPTADVTRYAFEWADANKVAQAFQTISESIKKLAAWTEANLEDKIWWNVALVTSDEDHGPNKLENFTITEDGQKIEFYVKIKNWAENGDYDTNAWVYLTYTWYDSEWNPIPWKELSIEDSSKIHRVQPPCGWTKPTVVEWVTKMWAETYPRKWNEAWDALEPMWYSEWTYVEANPNLEACEWTCNGEWYVRNWNTCVLAKYTVTWKNWDWEVLETDNDIPYGTIPTYDGEKDPAREGDAQYTYAFAWWDKAIVAVEWNQEYTATYTSTTNKYTVTWKNWDWEVLETDNDVPYGTIPTYDGEKDPAREGDAQYTYAFAWWDKAIVAVTADATYTATYSNAVNSYTIRFVNEDGTELQSSEVAYGETPVYTWNKPTKEADTVYTYEFSGWAPEIVEVTWEATYIATYSGIYIDYTVTFDNTRVQCHSWEKVPVPTYIPTKDSDETYTYEFAWWKIVNSETTSQAVMSWDVDCENIEYESTFKWTYIEYSVKWMDDNTELSGAVYHYNDSIVKLANPTKSGYVFSGWNPTVAEKVTGDATYTAEWKDDKNNNETPDDEEDRTITYTDGVDNEEVFVDVVLTWLDGLPTPAFNEDWSKPTRTGYVFSGWNPEIAKVVSGDQTYTAEWKVDSNGNGIADEDEMYTVIFDLNGWKVESWVKTTVQVLSWDNVKEITTSRDWYNFKEWTLSWVKFGFSTPITWDITLEAQWDKINNPWWGGGWGSTHYSCKWSIPANAEANNDLEPSNSNTSYSHGTDKSVACTFQCKSGYTRKDGKCVEQGWGNEWGDDEEEIELGWQVSDKCSVEWSNRSEEEIAAYLYACENDITTIRDIDDARLGDFLTRAEMAKMISVFATKELWMKPNTSKDCSNFAESIANYNQEMKDYMVMSCQLEVMWIHTTNYQAIPDFMPSKRVSRAEFGTILSRVLWWNKYEWTNENYYINHLNALKESNIITNINPNITEYRAWVFLMLYRSVEAIKIARVNNNESVEQQVNEELQEEWKAETGLVVEYDSWSVVPDMATVTASWTLTTWDIAKDEAKVETESTETETWSTND